MEVKTGNPFDYTPGKVYEIDIRLIEVDENAVFRNFDDQNQRKKLEELKESIKKNGLLENLIVYPVLTGFKLIAGYRRFTACKELGFEKVNCLVIEPEKAPEVLIEENEKREDLDFVEQAECYLYVIEKHKIEQRELAKRIGRSDAYVSNMLMVAKLDKRLKKTIRESEYFTKSVIFELLRLEDRGAIPYVIKYLLKHPMPTKKLRQFIKEINRNKEKENPSRKIKRAKEETERLEKLEKQKKKIDTFFKKYEENIHNIDIREINYLKEKIEAFQEFLKTKGYL